MKKHLQDRDKVALCGKVVQVQMEIDIVKVDCMGCIKLIKKIARFGKTKKGKK